MRQATQPGLATHNRRLAGQGQWLLGILLLALALRLALWAQPLHEPANDEIEYITVARDLNAGQGWSFYERYHWLRAPLYPLFLAGSLRLAGDDPRRAALPNILLSVANVGLAYLLARRLVGTRAALAAALITALLWTNATFASLWMAETLFTTLFSAALLLTLHTPAARHAWIVAAGAGVCFGLAALTRSAVLPFVPLAALWLLAQKPGRLSRLAIPLIVLSATLLTIAPWTLRNLSAYGRPILVETGLSYNLWAFNEPREDLETIQRTLEQIPNPAERSDLATAAGMARLREDPAILLRKLWPNWVFLARVKPIQDRFLMESYYDSVDLPLFVAALIFDDALYVLIALGAIAGLVLYRATEPRSRTIEVPPATSERPSSIVHRPSSEPPPAASERPSSIVHRPSSEPPPATSHQPPAFGPRWLALAWLATCIATMLLTHGEARYRHFLFPVLIPYAAAGVIWLAGLPAQLRSARRSAPGVCLLLCLALWAILLWTIGTSYPRDWAAENLARGWHTLAGDLASGAGQYEASIAAYRRAADAQKAPDPLLRLGDAALRAGDTRRALDAYREARRLIPIYEPTAVRLGGLLRDLGDDQGARDAFNAPYLNQQRMVERSWRLLSPAPREQLAVGDGLDYGFVRGVYPAEQIQSTAARWSGPRAWLRLSIAAGSPARLSLRLAAPHPGVESVPISICAGATCQTFEVGPAWREYTLVVERPGGDVVELRAPTFQAPDRRHLGVLIDSIWVQR